MKLPVAVGVAITLLSCTAWTEAPAAAASTAAKSKASIAELWTEPGPARNLRNGPGGARPRPQDDATYKVLERDTAGFSITYKVEDAGGREWNVKIGPEAQTEVVASRIVWAIGYHQPPSYFVERWTAIEDGERMLRGGARFRPKDDGLESLGIWQWRDNPFVGRRELNGLLVLMMLLNSSDLKDVNNELYKVQGGPRERAARWFVVKDLGASLGETGRMDPRRGFIDAFEQEPFIEGVDKGTVRFGFRGRHQNLLETIGVDDVKWLCARVMKITDRQWQDAFAAGRYPSDVTARYIARIKQKAAEGLALQ